MTTSARTRHGSDRTLVDHSVSVNAKLAGLLTATMLLYVYAEHRGTEGVASRR